MVGVGYGVVGDGIVDSGIWGFGGGWFVVVGGCWLVACWWWLVGYSWLVVSG